MSEQVIIIGAGLAGLVAAFAAREAGSEVLLVDRSEVGAGCNSAMANGRFAGPTVSYPAADYVRDTIRLGKMINHRPLVEQIAGNVASALDFMRRLGVAFANHHDHFFVKTDRLDVPRGIQLTRQLARGLKRRDLVRFLSGFQVTDILTSDGRAAGIRGLGRDGNVQTIPAAALVLATGGAGAVYLRNDNQRSTMGQGYYLAARAGIDLWDMEFVQFYPVVIAEPRLPSVMIYPPYPASVRLIDADGRDLLQKFQVADINDGMRKKRDSFSQLLAQEDAGGGVFLDLTGVAAADWEASALRLLDRIRFDFKNRPVRIAPGAHFFMGGIRVNESFQSSLAGLFACGEVTWGLHGANRLSGNALTECLVGGLTAGQQAADWTAHGGPSRLSKRSSFSPPASGTRPELDFRALIRRIRKIAWEAAGIVRGETGMQAGLAEVADIAATLKGAATQDARDVRRLEDLKSAVFVLRAILTAGLARRESRGAFVRREFAIGDDPAWRCNSCLSYEAENDRLTVSHHAVEATKDPTA